MGARAALPEKLSHSANGFRGLALGFTYAIARKRLKLLVLGFQFSWNKIGKVIGVEISAQGSNGARQHKVGEVGLVYDDIRANLLQLCFACSAQQQDELRCAR